MEVFHFSFIFFRTDRNQCVASEMEVLERRVFLFLLLAMGSSGATPSHSLRYFYTALSEPGHGLPLFIQVGYVNDQPITHYDSNIRTKVPIVPWMEKAVKDDPDYWNAGSHLLQGTETDFRTSLDILQDRYNHSLGGLHTWQAMYGCETGPDGQLERGKIQFAYDGEDFIALDRDTLTWTARVPQALPTKKRWEEKLDNPHSFNDYLLKDCMLWLQRYLDYGKETLLRTEAPTGRLARKRKDIGLETLICLLYGFYPKAIDVTWRKDGEVRDQDTFHGCVVPNSDGTYHTWRSIDIDPKERDLYQCHVEHDSLQKPLVLAWKEPASASFLGLILGIHVAILAVAIIASIIFIFLRQRRGKEYKAAPGSDQGSYSSTRVAVPDA